jgi:hypothetical protein
LVLRIFLLNFCKNPLIFLAKRATLSITAY